jgi:predicted phosphoadenosine phosphosulfate sulfurtransferase
VFDNFDNVLVSCSGGKDSDVTLQLAMMVAEEKGRLPLPVVWLDQEIEWQMVVDHVGDIMRDPRVDPRWMQIPFLISNATSPDTPWLDCWDESKEEDWIRPRDPISIKENTFNEKRFHEMFAAFVRQWHPDEPCAYLAGVRCEESPTRYTALTSAETYKGVTWGKTLNKRRQHFTFYPIYDWSYTDVWKALHSNKWSYCEVYDYFYQHGVPTREMRVSNLNHETAVRSLFIAHEIEPDTWGRVTKRLNGTNTAAVLKDDMLKCPKDLPFMFDSWQQYRDYLCDNLITDPKKQKAFHARFAKMDEQYADMLRKDDMYRVHIKSLLANDYEFVMTDNWERSPTINSLRNFWKGRYHSNNASNPYIDWSKFNADGSRITSAS